MNVRLVTDVKHDRLGRRVECAVNGDRQLNDTEIGAQMAAGLRNVFYQEFSDGISEAHAVSATHSLDRARGQIGECGNRVDGDRALRSHSPVHDDDG
jgi:hypothetical protein